MVPVRRYSILWGSLAASIALGTATPARAETPTPVIELFTMGQGPLLVERFGHAALCVCYPPPGEEGCIPKHPRPRRRPPGTPKDICYNYGTTDFAHPLSLGWGFLRNRAEFWVEPWDPMRMLMVYRHKDRSLWRQRLPVTPEQAREMAEMLAYDELPENRTYNYHHFYDNCTTRLRDIIDRATDGKLREGTEKIFPGPSFRDFSRQGFAGIDWMLVVTDLIMGRRGDIVPNLWQAMFLPDFLRQEVTDKFGVEPVLLYQRKGPPFPQDAGNDGRGWIFLFGFLVMVPIAITRWRGRFQRSGLIPAAIVLGLVGFIVWFLAVISALPEIRYNEVLLVCMPFDFALPFLGEARRRRYARIRLAILLAVSLLLAVGLFLQPLWITIVAVALPLGVVALPPGGLVRLWGGNQAEQKEK